MIVWFALVIPIITVIVLNIFWREKIIWWECFLPIGVSLVLITSGKLIVEQSQITDTEYWTGYPVTAEYYEPWNEWITKTCSRQVDDGNGKSHTKYYDCSYCEEHGPEWRIIDNNGIAVSIDSSFFNRLCNEWGNRQFVDMHRDYHTKDGDMYSSNWNQQNETIYPVVHAKWYNNRIQASHTIVNFPDVDSKNLNLFDYPTTGMFSGNSKFSIPSLLSKVPLLDAEEVNRRLSVANAKLGKTKQIRIWLLVWGPGSSIDTAMNQENYWKRGNKNELVICCGLDKNSQIQWSYVFSWTDKEIVKIACREKLLEQRGKAIDFLSFIDWLPSIVQSDWQRKNWHDFDYLSVEPPTWCVVLIYMLTVVVCGVVSYFTVINQFDEHDGATWSDLVRKYRR